MQLTIEKVVIDEILIETFSTEEIIRHFSPRPRARPRPCFLSQYLNRRPPYHINVHSPMFAYVSSPRKIPIQFERVAVLALNIKSKRLVHALVLCVLLSVTFLRFCIQFENFGENLVKRSSSLRFMVNEKKCTHNYIVLYLHQC